MSRIGFPDHAPSPDASISFIKWSTSRSVISVCDKRTVVLGSVVEEHGTAMGDGRRRTCALSCSTPKMGSRDVARQKRQGEGGNRAGPPGVLKIETTEISSVTNSSL